MHWRRSSTPPRSPTTFHALDVRLVGQYAVYFSWSDGHGTGIYPLDFLLDCVARREAGR
jgi:DUF971 family protein